MKIHLLNSAILALLIKKCTSFLAPRIGPVSATKRTRNSSSLFASLRSEDQDGVNKRTKGRQVSGSRLNSQTHVAAAASSSKSDNILEDSAGSINGELAERIFKWEQESRRERNLPQVDYSIRSGLRLVEELVQELLEERGVGGTNSNSKTNAKQQQTSGGGDGGGQLYSDLVQEGLAALLDAMQHYREEDQSQDEGKNGFDRYARAEIRQQLEKSLSRNLSNKPMRLPRSVINMVNQAKNTAQKMASKQGAQKPTIDRVAQSLGVPEAQLRDYLNLVKQIRPPTLSMESTMEITHPMLDESVSFQDFGDWKDENINVGKDGGAAEEWISEYYLDDPDIANFEGDDQAWLLQQSTSTGTLSDVIPDLEQPSPDDLALQEMIRHDLFDFLEGALTADEHAVVRSVFGLDSGKQLTLKRTAEDLDMSSEQVSILLAGGLQKLRQSYTKKYVEPYLESETPGRTMDSV